MLSALILPGVLEQSHGSMLHEPETRSVDENRCGRSRSELGTSSMPAAAARFTYETAK